MTQWGLDTLFNPAKRHMDEEKRRLQSTRQEVGDNSGGKRINFDSGKVTIRRTGQPSDDEGEAADIGADEQTLTASDEKSAAGSSSRKAATASNKPDPSPAQIRAARRRGREPR